MVFGSLINGNCRRSAFLEALLNVHLPLPLTLHLYERKTRIQLRVGESHTDLKLTNSLDIPTIRSSNPLTELLLSTFVACYLVLMKNDFSLCNTNLVS